MTFYAKWQCFPWVTGVTLERPISSTVNTVGTTFISPQKGRIVRLNSRRRNPPTVTMAEKLIPLTEGTDLGAKGIIVEDGGKGK